MQLIPKTKLLFFLIGLTTAANLEKAFHCSTKFCGFTVDRCKTGIRNLADKQLAYCYDDNSKAQAKCVCPVGYINYFDPKGNYVTCLKQNPEDFLTKQGIHFWKVDNFDNYTPNLPNLIQFLTPEKHHWADSDIACQKIYWLAKFGRFENDQEYNLMKNALRNSPDHGVSFSVNAKVKDNGIVGNRADWIWAETSEPVSQKDSWWSGELAAHKLYGKAPWSMNSGDGKIGWIQAYSLVLKNGDSGSNFRALCEIRFD